MSLFSSQFKPPFCLRRVRSVARLWATGELFNPAMHTKCVPDFTGNSYL